MEWPVLIQYSFDFNILKLVENKHNCLVVRPQHMYLDYHLIKIIGIFITCTTNNNYSNNILNGNHSKTFGR